VEGAPKQTTEERLIRIEVLMETAAADVREMKIALHSDDGLKARVRQLEEDCRALKSSQTTAHRWLWLVGSAVAIKAVTWVIDGLSRLG
jgi:hypothetical protein